MSNGFVVLHFQKGGSDKIWAIRKDPSGPALHDVWWGRRGSKMQTRQVPCDSGWIAQMNKKLSKGYREVENVTIDVENGVVIPLQSETATAEIPDALWYRVSTQIPLSLVRDYLSITRELVSDFGAYELVRLEQLPTFKALQDGRKAGGADYVEGPLALLLLFGLRRYLNELSGPASTTEAMQVANDANELLPERFAQIGPYLKVFCESWFINEGWVDSQTAGNPVVQVGGIGQQHELAHYTSLSAIKPLAIAMGCIDAPIDLTVIRTETKAAFF